MKKSLIMHIGAGNGDAQRVGQHRAFDVQVIEDRDNRGRSKGFAFAEMGGAQEAQAAIQGLNGKEHDGRVLTVN